MFTKYIPKNIQEKLKAKERAFARKNKPQNDDGSRDGYLSINDMATRTTFVRMCSNKMDTLNNYLIEGGLYDTFSGKKSFGFESLYKETGAKETTSGAKYIDDVGRKPIPGIKDIQIEYKGGFKAIRECTVNWSIPHIDDLDLLHDSFFTVGKTVVVDWGWIYPNRSLYEQTTDTFIERNQVRDTFEYIVKQEVFTNPQSKILGRNGDYDAIGGQITNFEYNLREDGGFDCVTKIIGMGSSLFKKPIDSGGNTAGIKISGKDAKSTPPDSLINCILNLKSILIKSSFGVDFTKIKATAQTFGSKTAEENRASKIPKVTVNKDYADEVGFISKDHNLHGGGKGGYSIDVDDLNNPQVLWLTNTSIGVTGNSLTEKTDFFVTWGWMEDNILSRYTSFTGGADKEVKLTMRSLDTVLHDEGDKEGQPILMDEVVVESTAKGPNLFDLEDKHNINLSSVSNLTTVVKKPTLIRNPPGLMPVNPFLFFTVDSNVLIEQNISMKREFTLNAELATEGPTKGGFNEAEFLKAFLQLNNKPNFKRFAKKGENFGALRNIWVNIKEIQSAFGIRNASSDDTSTSNINPPGTLDVGINNLLVSLNSNFHDIWSFETMVDPYDSTNIKIVDKADSELKQPKYTKFNFGDLTDTHKVGELGIFPFPSYKIGSIVKNQSLAYKIPNAQALTVLYGANKKKGENNSEFLNGQLDKIFELVRNPTKDKFLGNLETSNFNSSGNNGENSLNVGSEGTKPNSKIGIGSDFGVSIEAGATWWRRWTPDIDKKTDEKEASGFFNFFNKKQTNYEVITKDGTPLVQSVSGGTVNENPILYSGDMETGHIVLNDKVQYALKSYMHASSPVSQFDMTNLVPAELGLEIDGTGGITPFDIIHTEYIQDVYKREFLATELTKTQNEVEAEETSDRANTYLSGDLAEATTEVENPIVFGSSKNIGPLTFFQVTGVTHKIDSTGWKTELTSKMRINKFPRDDKLESIVAPKEKPITTTYKTQGVPNTLSEKEVGIVEKGIQAETEVVVEETWTPPTQASTIPDTQKELEMETEPQPPQSNNREWRGPGEKIGEQKIPADPDLNMSTAISMRNAGYTVLQFDGTPWPFNKPKETVKPAISPVKIKRSNTYKTSYDSLLEQLVTTQKVIGCGSPNTPTAKDIYPTTVGEVTKAQLFDNTVEVVELNFNAPEEAMIEVNEEIKKELPKEIIVDSIPKEAMIELKSTYQRKEHPLQTKIDQNNEVLYALREDWRPLYKRPNNDLTGERYTGKGANKVENVQVRKGILKPIRKAFWDTYIEEPTESGKTKATKNTLYSGTAIPAELMRFQRSVYWYGEYNPDPNY